MALVSCNFCSKNSKNERLVSISVGAVFCNSYFLGYWPRFQMKIRRCFSNSIFNFYLHKILCINPDFWVPLRNFFLNLGALSIKHARGFKVSTLIFLKILPLFDQKIAKYGLKNAFWSWKQQLWTVDFNITKIHGVSPLHLYSNVYIGIFLLLNIYEGVRVLYVCVRLAYFWKVCETCFSTFSQKFLGWLLAMHFVCKLGSSFFL